MNASQLANELHGLQYEEITQYFQEAKENNLVIFHGASDDLCEMDGAIEDEFGCYDGGEITFKNPLDNKSYTFEAVWHDEGEIYSCECGYQNDSDTNGAINVLGRFSRELIIPLLEKRKNNFYCFL